MFSFAPDFFRTWIYLLALKAGMNWIVKDFDRMQSEKSEKVNKASGRNVPHCQKYIPCFIVFKYILF